MASEFFFFSVDVAFFFLLLHLFLSQPPRPCTRKQPPPPPPHKQITVLHPAQGGHRGPRHGRVQQVLPERGLLQLRRLRRQAVRGRDQVRLWLRLARLLRRGARVAGADRGHLGRDGAHGDPVRQLRRAPGARLQGGKGERESFFFFFLRMKSSERARERKTSPNSPCLFSL